MEGRLKSLVYEFLTEVDPKVANIFKKNQKPKGLPGSHASLKEIVHYYDQKIDEVKYKFISNFS